MNVMIRYLALDKCFSNRGRRYTADELLEECNSALRNYVSSDAGISKATLWNDIRFMKSEEGYAIDLERIQEGRQVYFRYRDPEFSITHSPLSEPEAIRLMAAIEIASRFTGLPQLEWLGPIVEKLSKSAITEPGNQIIYFEENKRLRGIGFINELTDHILRKNALTITYQSFKREDAVFFEISPYALKQHNNRWYILGKSDVIPGLTVLALDRIISFKPSASPYMANQYFDFGEHFKKVVGITVPESQEEKEIQLKVSKEQWPYVRTKPLHPSQTIIEEFDDRVLFRITVVPNFELEKLLLSFGDALEVVSPISMRAALAKRIKKMEGMYKEKV